MLTIEFAVFLGQYYWGVIAVSKVVKKLGIFYSVSFLSCYSHMFEIATHKNYSVMNFNLHRASNFAGDWFKHLDCIACGWRREPRKSCPRKMTKFLILNHKICNWYFYVKVNSCTCQLFSKDIWFFVICIVYTYVFKKACKKCWNIKRQ